MERKSFLRSFAVAAAAGPLLFEACKKDSTTTKTDTSTSTVSTNGTTCTVTPTETEGPYPYVGGEITNPLNRADVTSGQTGVPLAVSFLVVNTNDNCNVVTGARVDMVNQLADFMILADGDTADKTTVDTFILKMQPNLSIISYQLDEEPAHIVMNGKQYN